MRGKLLNGIKSTYADSSVCVRVKGGGSEGFRIDIGVRQGGIMSPWMFNVCMKEGEDGDGKEGSEIPGGWERVEIV